MIEGVRRGRAGEGAGIATPSTKPGADGRAQVAVQIFAGSLLILGVLHVVFGEDLARMLRDWPQALPGRPLWAHAAGGVIALLAATMLILPQRARDAALALGGLILMFVGTLHIPRALPTGTFGDAWLNVLKWSALAGGTCVAATFLPRSGGVSWRDGAIARGAVLAPWLMAAFMLGSAILHVRFAEFVSQLIQPWMPWRLFWTYFAAVALASGGIGLVVPRTARLAALLTALMIFLWFWLVHTPRMLADPNGPVGWSEMAESLAFSAMALLLAARAMARR